MLETVLYISGNYQDSFPSGCLATELSSSLETLKTGRKTWHDCL